MKKNNRYEIKFVFDNIQTKKFLNYLYRNSHIKKKYNNRVVNSLYFDNFNMKSAVENLSGVAIRNKYRARWYNFDFKDTSIKNVYFETKSRKGRVGYKKSILFIDDLNKNNFYYNTFYKKYKNLIRKKNINYIEYDLFPKILVRYNRNYFENLNNIRVTVDNNIQFYDASSIIKKIYSGVNYKYNKNVVEIKFPIDQKEKIVNFLRYSSLNPTRHSKYLIGLSYTNNILYI